MNALYVNLIGLVCVTGVVSGLYRRLGRDRTPTTLGEVMVDGTLALVAGLPLGALAAVPFVLVGCLIWGPIT